jgi:hypothetical protein
MHNMSGKRSKLAIDLIPESCWKTSIRKSMPETEWNKIHQEVLKKAGDACDICGSKEKVVCHEIWQYDDKQHIQKLKGFHSICRMCYAVEHFGLSQVLAMKGYLNLNEVIKHFCKVNAASWDDFNKHKEKEFAKHRERSSHKWKTDFGKWNELITPKLDKNKRK